MARELDEQIAPPDELVLLRPGGDIQALHVQRAETVVVTAGMVDTRFEQRVLPALLEHVGADLYHNPFVALPVDLRGVRRVATIHDVVFRRRPELVDPSIATYLDHSTAVSCQIADAIVTVSQFSRAELLDLYKPDATRVHVIHNAVAPSLLSPCLGPGRDVMRPYVLYVGCLERKKNVLNLVRAFAALLERRPASPHRLVVVGGGAGGFEADLASLAGVPGVRDRVVRAGYVTDLELRCLYEGADLFCYLSEYEGFGLPPLEAMAAGVPTLVSNQGALLEITAGGAHAVEPTDVAAITKEMEKLLFDRTARLDLVSRGPTIARRFSWSSSARALIQLYEHVMQQPVNASSNSVVFEAAVEAL
jgi:glycosyltransferase involved in cell wall biosynthesis